MLDPAVRVNGNVCFHHPTAEVVGAQAEGAIYEGEVGDEITQGEAAGLLDLLEAVGVVVGLVVAVFVLTNRRELARGGGLADVSRHRGHGPGEEAHPLQFPLCQCARSFESPL